MCKEKCVPQTSLLYICSLEFPIAQRISVTRITLNAVQKQFPVYVQVILVQWETYGPYAKQ